MAFTERGAEERGSEKGPLWWQFFPKLARTPHSFKILQRKKRFKGYGKKT